MSLLPVSSGFRLRNFRSSSIMAIHLFFCLPRLRSPRTSDFIILLMLLSPDRSTCPYHLSLASRILSVMHATPIFFRMFSFLCISFREIPSIHLSILISVLSRSFPSFLLSVHASAPYIITGLIIVRTKTYISKRKHMQTNIHKQTCMHKHIYTSIHTEPGQIAAPLVIVVVSGVVLLRGENNVWHISGLLHENVCLT